MEDLGSMLIYKIHNKINNKIYIGLTTHLTLDKRKKQHLSKRKKGKNSLIALAISKYGPENFNFDIIEICNNKEDLVIQEKYWIKYYNSFNRNFGYNLTNGGDGCKLTNGYSFTEEHKRKLSEATKGSKRHTVSHSFETKLKISASKKGKITDYCKQVSKKIVCITNNIVYDSIEEAARKNNVYPQNILKVCKGLRKTTGNLKFKFYNE